MAHDLTAIPLDLQVDRDLWGAPALKDAWTLNMFSGNIHLH